MGGLSKAVDKAVGGGFLGDVLGAVVDPVGGVFKLTSMTFAGISDVLGAVGLDGLSKEVDRWADHNNQVSKVISGEYADDMKKIQEMGKRVEAYNVLYNAGMQSHQRDLDRLYDKLGRLIAFHEIFHMAMKNRIKAKNTEAKAYEEQYLGQLQSLMKIYEGMIAQMKNEYDFIEGLSTGNFIEKLVGGIIIAIGALQSDLEDIVSGKADGKTWTRVLTTVVTVIIIVLMWWNPAGWGAAAGIAAGTSISITTAVLATIGAVITIDGIYGNSLIMGSIMGSMDFIFNDILQLDSLIGSDFKKFDSNHEDYQEMVTFFKIGLTLATIISAWATAPSGGTGASNITSRATTTKEYVFGVSHTTDTITTTWADGTVLITTAGKVTAFGIDTSSLSSIYRVYQAATEVGNVVEQFKAHEAMTVKLRQTKEQIDSLVSDKFRKNFIKHYKDSAAFLQDQQEVIDRYVWQMTAQNMYVDPYGTTPVANIRFTPDEDTRMLNFGFEEVFDESVMAGSPTYFTNILYG